jgi:hypothetical protein
MRDLLLRVGVLLVAASVGAEDEAIDLAPGWNRGEVCDRTMTRTIRVRGNQMVGRVERAITAEMTEELDVRDKVLSTTPGGAAGKMERFYRRARQTTTTAVAGFDSDSKRQTDPDEGRTKTVAAGEADAFLVEMLDHAIYRKEVKVGDTWGGEDSGDEAEGRLSFKLVEVLAAKEGRTAKIHVTLKARVSTGQGAIDVEAKGYVHFSLDAGRIVRSSLSGPVKLELGELGTLHGTISEESTLAMVEAKESPGSEDMPTGGGLVRPGRNQ